MLLWNKFLSKSTSLPEIFSNVSSLWRRLLIKCRVTKKVKFYPDMQILDEPWRLQIPPYYDTQGIYQREEEEEEFGTSKLPCNVLFMM